MQLQNLLQLQNLHSVKLISSQITEEITSYVSNKSNDINIQADTFHKVLSIHFSQQNVNYVHTFQKILSIGI